MRSWIGAMTVTSHPRSHPLHQGLARARGFHRHRRDLHEHYVGMTRAKERLMITASGKNEFTERLESMMGQVFAVA
jgi:hypothetical protein